MNFDGARSSSKLSVATSCLTVSGRYPKAAAGRDLLGHTFGAPFEYKVGVHVPYVVLAVLDFEAVLVELAGFRAPTIQVLVEPDATTL